MNYVKELQLEDMVKQALREDIGRGDITTQAVIPKNKPVKAILLAKENCIVCGIDVARLVFKLADKNIKFASLTKDGQRINQGKAIARIEGKAQTILAAERVALNYLCLLSGISTTTRSYVEKIMPHKAKIMDTRKTIPGLRELQKYAVRVGGGFNHRMRLDEMILVKDNHLKAVGGYQNLPRIIKGCTIELEVRSLKEFKEALKLGPDIVMLDNASIEDIKSAVKFRDKLIKDSRPRPKIEASGGITLKNVRRFASAGVDMISIGALTHNIKSVDISLEIL